MPVQVRISYVPQTSLATRMDCNTGVVYLVGPTLEHGKVQAPKSKKRSAALAHLFTGEILQKDHRSQDSGTRHDEKRVELRIRLQVQCSWLPFKPDKQKYV